jgi:hypothetical protein
MNHPTHSHCNYSHRLLVLLAVVLFFLVIPNNTQAQDAVWVDDALPSGASPGGDESWTWVTSDPSPFAGTSSHQSGISSWSHQHYFSGATATLSISAGDKLFAYVYIDPNNVPSEIMFQWNDGDWNHRAYWGANNLGFGDDGGASRHYMGPLPATGQWVRLEIGAVQVGLEGRTLNGMAFSLYGGRVTFDAAGKFPQTPVNNSWVDDRLPAGSSVAGNEPWNWETSPTPFSGNYAHQSSIVSGFHQHYFQGAMDTLTVSTGEALVAYVFLDPQNTPSEIMLQWNDGSWEHRAYWGADQIETSSTRINKGSLPAAGEWVRLEVPASDVSLENTTINGMAFKLYGGRAAWDKVGKTTQQTTNNPPTVSISTDQTSYTLPAYVNITANANDSDGTITKVEFFEGTTQIGQDTTAPYTLTWENVPTGTYTLTAKATDDLGATALSTEVIITVNPIPFPSTPIPCPTPSATTTEGDLKEGHSIPVQIALAPCETVNVAVVASAQGGAVTLTLHNNVGTTILTDNWNPPGAPTLENIPYDSAPWIPPYRGTRGPEGLPKYAIFESRTTDVHYKITVTKKARSKYNLGGNGFGNALDVTSLPASYYGSLWPTEQGQYFKIHLQGNESVYLSGFALGHWFYSANFTIKIYNSSQELITDLVNLTPGGRYEYANVSFTNPNANAADFYLHVTCSEHPIHDFELNIQTDHCSATAEEKPVAPNASGMGPLAVTSSEYKLPASIDSDVLADRETELWAKMYHPSDFSSGPYPLIVLLHGNHSTCGHLTNPRIDDDSGYTLTGMCGFVPFFKKANALPPRNDSSGWFGMKFTTGPNAVVIKSLGRIFISGNTGTHNIKIVKVSDGTAAAATTVTMTAGSAPFRYSDLATPVTLPANTSYYLVSEEFSGGDTWYPDATITTRDVAAVNGPASSADGNTNWNVASSATHGYVILDFKYDLASPAEYSVVPNHLGYEYLAQQLASRGYIVVSINANRGINAADGVDGDDSLILARGRLVLKHLQKLSEWSVNGGAPISIGDLTNKIDFNNVGLMGHSRGGQGVRAAHVLYNDPGSPWVTRILRPVHFKAVFEVGPTDELTTRDVNGIPDPVISRLEVNGANEKATKWNVLLPMCDGDVAELAGVRPFDRIMVGKQDNPPAGKSSYLVWGTNHNFYNTEWQQNENSTACIGDGNVALFSPFNTGSAQQRQIASESVVGFFRANVGNTADDSFNQNFNPRFKLPNFVSSFTRVDRGYTPSPDSTVTTSFDDFDASVSNLCASPNQCGSSVQALKESVPEHDATLSAASIIWTSSGPNQYFQSTWKISNGYLDVTGFQTLDFRVSRQLSELNPVVPTTFSIQLVMSDGSLSSSVPLCKYFAQLLGPVGESRIINNVLEPNYHRILETVRIPVSDFTGADLTHIRAIRFIFDGTPQGALYLANIRFAK